MGYPALIAGLADATECDLAAACDRLAPLVEADDLADARRSVQRWMAHPACRRGRR